MPIEYQLSRNLEIPQTFADLEGFLIIVENHRNRCAYEQPGYQKFLEDIRFIREVMISNQDQNKKLPIETTQTAESMRDFLEPKSNGRVPISFLPACCAPLYRRVINLFSGKKASSTVESEL